MRCKPKLIANTSCFWYKSLSIQLFYKSTNLLPYYYQGYQNCMPDVLKETWSPENSLHQIIIRKKSLRPNLFTCFQAICITDQAPHEKSCRSFYSSLQTMKIGWKKFQFLQAGNRCQFRQILISHCQKSLNNLTTPLPWLGQSSSVYIFCYAIHLYLPGVHLHFAIHKILLFSQQQI